MNAQADKRLHDIVLTVALRAPWLVHGNDPGRLGLDAVQLRAPDGRRRLLPGTLLAGRIRDAWHVLKKDFLIGEVPDAKDWFGPTSDSDAAEDVAGAAQPPTPRRQPQRARIVTADLVECGTPPQAPLIHTRVQIDTDSGAGIDGMLQSVEQREPPGTALRFQGTWRVWLAEGEAPALQAQLLKALLWQTQLGALRSVGFGELLAAGTDVQIAPAGAAHAAEQAESAALQASFAQAQPPFGHARGLRLRFDRPLAVANRLVNGNLFQSDDFLPGAALKGALAHAWDRSRPGRPKPAWFDALRITHAQPCGGSARPAPLPFSLVAGLGADDAQADKLIWDLAQSPGAAPDLIDAHGRAVSFEPDWKGSLRAKASKRQQRGQVLRYLRVRTAIDGGQAKDGSLFGYDCVVSPHLGPLSPTGQPEPETHWAATLDLPAELDTKANWEHIAELLAAAPLGPLGKTDAYAALELVPDLPPVWPSRLDTLRAGATVTLLLASPALLFASSQVAGNTSVRQQPMQDVYARAFDGIAAATPGVDGTPPLALQRFYARQRLAGGEYLAHRFRRADPARPYLPYVLTEAGSVFVFTVADADRAKTVLTHWQRHGLPLNQAVRDEHGADWRTNPWLPENGYGEVAVNPDTGFPASLQAAREQAQAAQQPTQRQGVPA